MACARVGQVDTPVAATAVVVLAAEAVLAPVAAVDDAGVEELMVGLLLADPQPASTSAPISAPAVSAPAGNHVRPFTHRTLATHVVSTRGGGGPRRRTEVR